MRSPRCSCASRTRLQPWRSSWLSASSTWKTRGLRGSRSRGSVGMATDDSVKVMLVSNRHYALLLALPAAGLRAEPGACRDEARIVQGSELGPVDGDGFVGRDTPLIDVSGAIRGLRGGHIKARAVRKTERRVLNCRAPRRLAEAACGRTSAKCHGDQLAGVGGQPAREHGDRRIGMMQGPL